MRFAHPQLLWLLVLLAPLGAFAWVKLAAGRRKLTAAIGPHLAGRLTGHLFPRRSGWRIAVLLFACACLLLGLAGPQRGTHYTTAARKGIDLIVALDVSESMLAEDLRPNRLERALFLDVVAEGAYWVPEWAAAQPDRRNPQVRRADPPLLERLAY